MFKEKFDIAIEYTAEAINDFLWLIGDRNIEITGYTKLGDKYIIIHCKAPKKIYRSFISQHELSLLANIIDKEKEEQE